MHIVAVALVQNETYVCNKLTSKIPIMYSSAEDFELSKSEKACQVTVNVPVEIRHRMYSAQVPRLKATGTHAFPTSRNSPIFVSVMRRTA